MFEFIKNLFRSDDKTETEIKEKFAFLFDKYGFSFSKTCLGNLEDEDGKLIFYGPYDAYQMYDGQVCINILHLVQRDEYEIFITDACSTNQQYIRKGVAVPSYMWYDLSLLAREIKAEISSSRTIFGKSIG